MSRAAHGNFFMLFLIIYEIIFTALIAFIFSMFPALNTSNGMALSAIAEIFMFFPPVVVYTAINKQRVKRLLPFKKINTVNILFIMLVAIIAQPIAMSLSGLSAIFFPNAVSEIINDFNSTSYLSTVLVVCVVPAIFEELPLRGIIQSEYKNAPVAIAAFVNGLFFGMIHLNLQQFLYAFFLGIVLFYLVHITGSILSSILAHFLFNFMQVSLSALVLNLNLVEHASAIEEAAPSAALLATVWGALFIVFVPVLILVLWAQTRYNKSLPKKTEAPLNEAEIQPPHWEQSAVTIHDIAPEYSVTSEIMEKSTQKNGKLPIFASFFAIIVIYVGFMILLEMMASV